VAGRGSGEEGEREAWRSAVAEHSHGLAALRRYFLKEITVPDRERIRKPPGHHGSPMGPSVRPDGRPRQSITVEIIVPLFPVCFVEIWFMLMPMMICCKRKILFIR
jgi:hypothetical protein